ncbi:Bacteriophytochrome (Light-regulated signal transduction histidine kinase) [Hyella patelloides LEGE 07179]|uniref:histidine kinase n=1 Tax=Hyella patelloides LEGE 07179 TaxID=945734 RepID=A0A563VW90_9CYAN|nr:ATP-binding protein [Hyella patelloides]VEP15665.1 Bacteriophytochrome (Light-regulated signal transduction histidine kinase) [Hyella patelloides LEGE 07179]
MLNEMTIRQYTILIVDDSAEDRQAYRRYLSKVVISKYKIIEAESGEEGLEQLASIQPDLILLDYLLPDFDGLELIEELKSQLSQIPPIIMLTGQGNELVAVKAMKSGVKDYLVKGKLTAEILTISVKNVLQQHHLQSLLTQNFQQQQLIAETALHIRQSLDLSEILEIAVKEVQLLLNCDRVAIYQFAPDMSGDIVAESVKSGWKQSLGQKVIDTCFQNNGTARYDRGETLAIDNIYESELSECHIELLEEFQVKANAIIPILLSPYPSKNNPSLWGLLIAHQCSDSRHWETEEVNLLDKLAVQLAIAIQQAELLGNLQNELDTRKKAENSLQEKALQLEWANQELLNITSLLKKRNQELDHFAYVTSHDLKAPLRAIANLATWLSEDLEDQIPEENQQQLQLMQSRVKRMDGLIQGLLEYSRVGRKNIPVKTIHVGNLVKEAIDSLSPPPEFEIIVAEHMPTLKTEALLLQQVFSNLISNAIKYHPQQKGKITISVKEQDKFYEFAVSDDGLGIDPQYHERIFTIFQTLQARDTIESTGIGLSIVKKIVEGQGGKIWVESQLGEGATFYFTWQK